MVLVSLPEERTDYQTTRFNLAFQQITIAKTQAIDASKYFKKPSEGQTKSQVQEKANNGKQQGKEVPESSAFALKETIKGFF